MKYNPDIIASSVRVLADITKDDIVITSSEAGDCFGGNVYLCAMVHTASSAKDCRDGTRDGMDEIDAPTPFQEMKLAVKKGTVEYMVSDGPPGERHTSFDFLDFNEAYKCYKEIAKNGWRNYGASGRIILDHENGKCPDCQKKIPKSIGHEEACKNCGHVFLDPFQKEQPYYN